MRTSVDASELLANTRWVRRLAGHLVRDPNTADDLAQETWMAAADNAVPQDVPLSTWLAGILRNLVRLRARSEARRSARERLAATDEAQPATPESAVERMELYQQLGRLLLDLAEPYRSTLVLRYYEGLSASEIARRTGVPAGTVRWRLKQGLDTIRARLDEKWGRRAAWIPIVAPLGRGSRFHHLAVAALAVAVAGGAALLLGRAPVRDSRPTAAVSSAGKVASGAPPPATDGGRPSPTLAMVGNRPPVPRVKVPLGAAPIVGPPGARVTVLLLGEYECFFSARAYQALEQVRLAHPADVRVQLVQAPLPVHPGVSTAARAAYAAGEQGKYWEMHRLLFANPDQLVSDPRIGRFLKSAGGRPMVDNEAVMRRPDLAPADVESYAGQLGLDVDRFRADLNGPAVEQRLAIDAATVESAGEINAIPVMFINGRRVNGSRRPEELEEIVAEELRSADAMLAAGVPAQELYNRLPGQSAIARRHMPASPAAARPAATASDDFESGGLGGWRTETAGAGGWFVYSSGKSPPDPGSSDRRVPFDVPDPPRGKFAAVTDMNAPGTRILYRDVTLDGRYRLQLVVYYVSAGPLTRPIVDTLDFRAAQSNHQYRVDLISVGAPLDAVTRPEVLAAIYRAPVGGRRQDPTPITFDLSPWRGQAVRLRLAVTDNRGPVRAGVDDVRFERIGD
jgi:RNA polymerase sigma factor (sigma-70 family)